MNEVSSIQNYIKIRECPVPKKGNLRLASNHRPVQLNSPLSKVAEAVINNQLKIYLENNSLIPRTQNSYRSGYSTFSALADIDTILNEARSKGKQSMILATDMSSAFNLVHRDILDSILEEYKIDNFSRKLIYNYMSDRRVKVKIKNQFSEWKYLNTGVGEGTIVGPLFFIIVLTPISSAINRAISNVINERNEMNMKVEREMFQVLSREYADDVSGVITADNDDILQIAGSELMKQFKLFFSAIGMSLNPSKTEILCIRSKAKTREISIEGQIESLNLKLLGLTLDSNLNYELHVSNLKNSLNYKMAGLRRLAPFMNYINMKRITEAIVHSSISCSLPIYGHGLKNQRSLQKTVNSAARIVLGRGPRSSATEMMHDLDWLNVRNLYILEAVCSLNRIITTRSASYAFDIIYSGHRKKQNAYNTRDSSIHLDLDYKSKFTRQSFLWNATYSLNSLELGKKIVPAGAEYRKHIRSEILKKFTNENL